MIFQRTSFLILFFSMGCSNPFSGKSAPQETYRTQNFDCNSINFKKETLDPAQMRGMIHCLNSAHELDEVESFAQSLSDPDWRLFTDSFNQVTVHKPKSLFALHDHYEKLKKTGEINYLQQLGLSLIENPAQTASLAAFLNVEAPLFSRVLELTTETIHLKNLNALTLLPSYQRFIQENYVPQFFRGFIPSLSKYLSAQNSTSVAALYRLLSENKVELAWSKMTSQNPKRSIQNLAFFFDWLFKSGGIKPLSETLDTIQKNKIQCFKDQREIKNPLLTALQKISTLSSREAKDYLNHDLKNTLMLARGYCSIPYSLDALFAFLNEASDQPGYDEIFTLIKPLILDSRFTQFLSSSSTRTWALENQFLTETHFFYDFLTLIEFTQHYPLTASGETFSKTIDELFIHGNAEQITNGFISLEPLFNKKNEYLGKTFHFFDQIISEFPIIPEPKLENSNHSLQLFLKKTLQYPQLNALFLKTAKLIREHKIISMIDQTLLIFESYLGRGKFNIHYLAFQPENLKSFFSYSFLLDKLSNVSKSIHQPCAALSSDWQFNSDLKKLDLLLKCQNSNTITQALSDLAHAANQKLNALPFILKTQASVINHLMLVDSHLLFDTVAGFLSLTKSQLNSFHQYFTQGAQGLSLIQEPFLVSQKLRQFMAGELKKPSLFTSLSELFQLPKDASPPLVTMNDQLKLFSKIDTLIDRDQSLMNIDFDQGLRALIMQYCPSLDINDKNCEIDDDQVKLYLASPPALSKKIKTDYLISSQNWLYPSKNNTWSHTEETPTQIKEIEYHLNPLLHLLRSAPSVASSFFSAIQLIQNQSQDLNSFLKDRAFRFQLIPYYYELPHFPLKSKREFHSRLRIRITSDLDRLELLAMNADFKAFHLTSNFGLTYIREIGLAWGDEPASRWPPSLSKFKNLERCSPDLPEGGSNCVRTALQVKNYIHSEMSKFDKGILQQLGNCDPRGHTALTKWLQNKLCNPELSDISARLFNLRFLISLLDKELPDQNDGIRVLRNLFYGLYAHNQESQFNQFPNGLQFDSSCLENPGNELKPICQFDNLTLISRLTRLGLIHQIGLSYLNQTNSPMPELINFVNRIASQETISNSISLFLNTKAAQTLLEDGLRFSFQTKSHPANSLSSIAKTASYIENLNWVNPFIAFVNHQPKIISKMTPLFETILEQDFINTQSLNLYASQNRNNTIIPYLNDLSSRLTPNLMIELSDLILHLENKQETASNLIINLHQIKPISSEILNESTQTILNRLSLPEQSTLRNSLSDYFNGTDLNRFCTVFTDAEIVNKTYIFLESFHQNPDSASFIQSLKNFLEQP